LLGINEDREDSKTEKQEHNFLASARTRKLP